jgi:hypothetical protein
MYAYLLRYLPLNTTSKLVVPHRFWSKPRCPTLKRRMAKNEVGNRCIPNIYCYIKVEVVSQYIYIYICCNILLKNVNYILQHTHIYICRCQINTHVLSWLRVDRFCARSSVGKFQCHCCVLCGKAPRSSQEVTTSGTPGSQTFTTQKMNVGFPFV